MVAREGSKNAVLTRSESSLAELAILRKQKSSLSQAVQWYGTSMSGFPQEMSDAPNHRPANLWLQADATGMGLF